MNPEDFYSALTELHRKPFVETLCQCGPLSLALFLAFSPVAQGNQRLKPGASAPNISSSNILGKVWKLVDSLAQEHSKIQAPVLLIWGQDDPVFPVEPAKQMVPQFKDCRGFKVIPNAKLFVQEEQPEIVARDSIEFLKD